MMGPSYQYKATMIRVIDGDTYEVEVDLGFRIYHHIHVRLRNFNTAELRAKIEAERVHAGAARDFVMNLMPKGTEMVLVTAKAAVYNRWEAHVYFQLNGAQLSLADLLTEAGFARKESYQ